MSSSWPCADRGARPHGHADSGTAATWPCLGVGASLARRQDIRACGRALDIEASLTRFYGTRPAWLDTFDPSTPEGIAAFLDDLRGSTSITDLSENSGISRCSVSRWLSGRTQPRLPDFFQLIEAASVRLVDLIAALVDPSLLPSIHPSGFAWVNAEARLSCPGRSSRAVPWIRDYIDLSP